MTKRIDIMKRHIGLLGVLAAMAIAPLAHADYEIAFQVVGSGGVMACLDNPDSTNSGSLACGNTVGGIKLVGLSGSSDSPGVSSGANEFSSSGSLANMNAAGSSPVTIDIWYLAQGFTMPVTGGGVTGIKYTSNSSGTGGPVTGVDTLGLESCVDGGAGGVGANFCANSPFASLTNGVLTYPVGGGAVSDSINKQFSPLTATYALEQEVTVVLAAGDTVNYSDSQFLTPVPEPMSVALLGGVLLVTSRAIRRKRKQQNGVSA